MSKDKDSGTHEELQEHVEPSEEHKQYLIQRHGTIKLDPLPQMDDNDPLNWPMFKKLVNLSLVAFHAFLATFSAASIQSAFVDIADDLFVTVPRTTYLVSLFIAILGGAPLFWRPLSQTYGRRPIFLISLIGSLVGNVGCACSHSYATMGLCRAIVAFFISPAASIGSVVVLEMFFRNQRGRYMGIWTSMVTLGVPLAPFVFGFAVMRVGYRWIYWVLVIVNGIQFVLYFFIGPESRYVPATSLSRTSISTYKRQYFIFRRIDPAPMTVWSFFHPLSLALQPCVMAPAVAYAMIFLWGSVFITIETPQVYPELLGFDEQQVGLQFASVLIGTIVGEQIGGFSSDKWMCIRRNKLGYQPANEHRLWVSYPGQLLTIGGVVTFLVRLDGATRWEISPLIGAAVAAAGNQIVTTVMMTYAVDCFPHDAAAVGVFVIFVRQIWGFIGPFWFADLVENLGLTKSSIVAATTIIVASLIPTVLLQALGKKWHPKESAH